MAKLEQSVIDRARALWIAEPSLQIAELAERLGMSKNALSGIAHRNEFPSRAKPQAKPHSPERDERARQRSIRESSRRQMAQKVEDLKKDLTVPAPKPVVVFKPATGGRTCQFPLWKDRPDFRFCDAPVIGVLPYCEEHCRICYINHEFVLAARGQV